MKRAIIAFIRSNEPVIIIVNPRLRWQFSGCSRACTARELIGWMYVYRSALLWSLCGAGLIMTPMRRFDIHAVYYRMNGINGGNCHCNKLMRRVGCELTKSRVFIYIARVF